MVIGDQSHIFIYFPDGRLLLGFGIVVCRAKGFSLTEAPTERHPPKVAWGHRRIGVTGGLAKSFLGVWRNFEKISRAVGRDAPTVVESRSGFRYGTEGSRRGECHGRYGGRPSWRDLLRQVRG
jgi:hypothetical protein